MLQQRYRTGDPVSFEMSKAIWYSSRQSDKLSGIIRQGILPYVQNGIDNGPDGLFAFVLPNVGSNKV